MPVSVQGEGMSVQGGGKRPGVSVQGSGEHMKGEDGTEIKRVAAGRKRGSGSAGVGERGVGTGVAAAEMSDAELMRQWSEVISKGMAR